MIHHISNWLASSAGPRLPGILVLLVGLGPFALPVGAQPPPAGQGTPAAPVGKAKPKEVPLIERLRSPYEADRPVAEKLRSPREALKTLYFAAILYDIFPEMIADAVACLDLDEVHPRPTPADAAMLALDLENILDSLALPLSRVPDEAAGDAVVLHDAGPATLSMRRGPDGGWRFDAKTLGRLPALRLAAAERRRQRTAVPLASLREGLTDPRATMRQFISDVANGDFYAAARALDLSTLSAEQRRQQGPVLAQQLAFALQRRGFMFREEVPDWPDGPAYTWHADQHGRIALERVRQADGKDAWLFTRLTVRNVPRMYAAVQGTEPNPRYVRLRLIVPGLETAAGPRARKRPEDVPAHLGSPRALLQGFFRTMDAADANDARLADALEYLDLDHVPLADRGPLGAKLATKLEAVLRRLPIDLSTVPDDWNAAPQALGDSQESRVEILRQRNGRWCFSAATIARLPEMFDKLAGKGRSAKGRGTSLDSARDLVMTFQDACGRRDFVQAAACLNLDEIHSGAQDNLGPVLALKLKYVLDRIGRVYIQEIPDNPEGARYILYRGELGRIVLDRRAKDPAKGAWQFTPETIQNVEPMFRAVLGAPCNESEQDDARALAELGLWESPGVWLRLKLPSWSQVKLGPVDLYQWPGFPLVILASWLAAWITLTVVCRVAAWLLRRGKSVLSPAFVSSTLRPLRCLAVAWTFFLLLGWLDLPVAVADPLFAAEKFLMVALLGWLGLRLIDLSMAVYTNTESLRPHRNLGDMIVPVAVRLGKGAVLLIATTYVVYQIGEIDLLARFMTGLGVAGLAASLAAQDVLKSFFGTLLLIGERAFKIGDRILVGGTEGVVEQVGFRSTRLRTAEDSVLTLPNSIIAAAPIDNMGARSHRRFSATITMGADASLERLLELRDRLRAWLEGQPLVVQHKADVHVHRITNDGVELSVSLFLATGDGAEETGFREEINCEVLAQAAALGVRIAPASGESVPGAAGSVGRSQLAA
jgi:MscS family membrane protein